MTYTPTPPPNWRYRLALWLVPEFSRLRTLNQDLTYQLSVATRHNGIDPDTARAYAKQGEDFTRLNDEFNELGLYLRDNYRAEIESGQHKGMRLIDLFVKYCNKGK